MSLRSVTITIKITIKIKILQGAGMSRGSRIVVVDGKDLGNLTLWVFPKMIWHSGSVIPQNSSNFLLHVSHLHSSP